MLLFFQVYMIIGLLIMYFAWGSPVMQATFFKLVPEDASSGEVWFRAIQTTFISSLIWFPVVVVLLLKKALK